MSSGTQNPFKAITAAERREIDRTRDEEIEGLPEHLRLRVKAVPAPQRALHLRVVTGKASARLAIKAFCQECIGFDNAEIGRCSARSCRLWSLRPYQPKAAPAD